MSNFNPILSFYLRQLRQKNNKIEDDISHLLSYISLFKILTDVTRVRNGNF